MWTIEPKIADRIRLVRDKKKKKGEKCVTIKKSAKAGWVRDQVIPGIC